MLLFFDQIDKSAIFATMLQEDVLLSTTTQKEHIASFADSNAVLENTPESKGSDFLGLSGSFLCLLHCLAPQLISLGLLGVGVGNFFSGEIWALVFWFTCIWAVRTSARNSVYPAVSVFLWISLFVFTLGLFLENFAGLGKEISYTGSGLLIVAHLINLRLQGKWRQTITCQK